MHAGASSVVWKAATTCRHWGAAWWRISRYWLTWIDADSALPLIDAELVVSRHDGVGDGTYARSAVEVVMQHQPHVIRFGVLGPDAQQLRHGVAHMGRQFTDAQSGGNCFDQHQA